MQTELLLMYPTEAQTHVTARQKRTMAKCCIRLWTSWGLIVLFIAAMGLVQLPMAASQYGATAHVLEINAAKLFLEHATPLYPYNHFLLLGAHVSHWVRASKCNRAKSTRLTLCCFLRGIRCCHLC